MKILEGAIPKGVNWRVLVLLSPDENLGRAFALGSALAHSNGGELVTAVFVTDESEEALTACRDILNHAQDNCQEKQIVHSLIIASTDQERDLKTLIHDANIDLLLVHADSTIRHDYARLSCGVVALRGDRVEIEGEEAASGKRPLARILVPTAGGPNTAHALTFLLPLTPDVEVTMLYVVAGERNPGGERLGNERLSQLAGLCGCW